MYIGSLKIQVHCLNHRLEFRVKKEGLFGGGSTKVVHITGGQGDEGVLKIAGGALTVSIGPGLPKNAKPSDKLVPASRPGQARPLRSAPAPRASERKTENTPAKGAAQRVLQGGLAAALKSRGAPTRHTPNLPQSAPSHREKQSPASATSGSAPDSSDYMKPPEAGVSG